MYIKNKHMEVIIMAKTNLERKSSKKFILFFATIFLLSALNAPSFALTPSDETLIKKAVTDYYDTRYQALSALEEKDISIFWDSNNNPNYEVELAALSTDINHRKMQLIDLGIIKYNLEMDFKTVNIQNDKAEVNVVELCSFYQNAVPDICSQIRDEHNIKLEKTKEKWLLVSDVSNDFTKKVLLGKVRKGKSASQAKEEILANSAEQVKLKKKESLNLENGAHTPIAIPLSLQAYNPDNAVNYALDWAFSRNTDQWGDYDSNGGDCTNFVSQCLYAGGIPFDTVGNPSYNQRWFWYSNSNRTPPWTGVVPFWDYAINDTGVGLVATSTTRTGIYIGDVVQFYNSNDGWHHTVFVHNAFTSNNYRYLYIACHTQDQCFYNIDNYVGESFRYMHINGWNN